MFDPYGWTRDGEQAPRRRAPARWYVSALVAVVVGAAAFGLVLMGYVVTLTVLGLADAVPAGVGAVVALLGGAVAAVATWRGIRARWERMPPGGEARWQR